MNSRKSPFGIYDLYMHVYTYWLPQKINKIKIKPSPITIYEGCYDNGFYDNTYRCILCGCTDDTKGVHILRNTNIKATLHVQPH